MNGGGDMDSSESPGPDAARDEPRPEHNDRPPADVTGPVGLVIALYEATGSPWWTAIGAVGAVALILRDRKKK